MEAIDLGNGTTVTLNDDDVSTIHHLLGMGDYGEIETLLKDRHPSLSEDEINIITDTLKAAVPI